MTEWIAPLVEKLAQGISVVRMVVASIRGSAPREAGATLLYWRDSNGNLASLGTIGGGHLEFKAMEVASYMLNQHDQHLSAQNLHAFTQSQSTRKWQRFVLGASLGQCCGGVVELYWERFDNLSQAQCFSELDLTEPWLRYCVLDDEGEAGSSQQERETLIYSEAMTEMPRLADNMQAAIVRQAEQRYFVERLHDTRQALWIYGAGHVGSALVQVLQALPFNITWVDSRPEVLSHAMRTVTKHVVGISEEPHLLAAKAPLGAWHVVMTHNHDEDMQICEALLAAHANGFLGLIGSQSKSTRFRQRLLNKGFLAEQVEAMHCPIGMAGLASKLPSAIAVSVAFQLLQLLEQNSIKHQVSSALNESKLNSNQAENPTQNVHRKEIHTTFRKPISAGGVF